jgi:hypothetical protein
LLGGGGYFGAKLAGGLRHLPPITFATMNIVRLTTILGLCATVHARSQNTAAFVDPYDDFIVFENGLFEKVEGQRPVQYKVIGDQVGYVAYNGDVKVRSKGKTTTLERIDGVRPLVTDHYIAYNNVGTLKVWDGTKLNTICYNTESFLLEDSLVAFYDGVRQMLNVFYQDRVILLEDALASWPVENWKGADNILAWITTFEKKFKVLYQGGVYELGDLVRGAEYETGRDVVAYRDVSDQGFKIFHRGEVHDVEAFMPKSYQCGMGLVAYLDQSDELKVFQNGKVYTVLDYAPTSYQALDSLVVIRDSEHLLVFHDGVTTTVTQYWPETWKVSLGTLAWIDSNNNVVLWKDGNKQVVLRGGPFDHVELLRGLVLAIKGSTARVWWNGEVYTY